MQNTFERRSLMAMEVAHAVTTSEKRGASNITLLIDHFRNCYRERTATTRPKLNSTRNPSTAHRCSTHTAHK